MIEPYNAVGLVPTFWGIRQRDDIQKNIEHLNSLTKAAFWLSNLDIPVSRAARRCTTAAEESCTTGTMRKD